MIDHYSFGSMTVDGRKMQDDVKIVDGTARDGWWRGSGHLCTARDIEDVFEARPDILVIGTGASGRMRVDESVRKKTEELDIDLVVKPSGEATEEFNRLEREGRHVAGAFHLTC